MMDQQPQPLPPIKATEPGKHGRKHTIGQVRLNSAGKVEVSFKCDRPECGCGGWYVLEELLEGYRELIEKQGSEAA